jgi:hypothetical protein
LDNEGFWGGDEHFVVEVIGLEGIGYQVDCTGRGQEKKVETSFAGERDEVKVKATSSTRCLTGEKSRCSSLS